MNSTTSNAIYIQFNALGVAAAYVMLGLSIWLTDIPLSAKGYWAMGVFLLTACLVNTVKYRMDDRLAQERISKLETAKNEKILEEFVQEK